MPVSFIFHRISTGTFIGCFKKIKIKNKNNSNNTVSKKIFILIHLLVTGFTLQKPNSFNNNVQTPNQTKFTTDGQT